MTDSNQKESYQIGEHDIDKTAALGGEDDFIEFQFESAAIFKRLADDIYESDEAGIREPLANSITAVRRAESEHGINNGVIEVTLSLGESPTLTIRDNGIGISRSVLNEVLSVIGRSTNRDDGEVSGKYGMGFLACYKLVGLKGGFIMHTNSRKTNNPPVSGLWKPGGFDIDSDESLEEGFDKNEYGTKLEFPLKPDLNSTQIRKWVETHARWSRVPVVYREFDEDGNEVHNEDFGTNRLEEQYDGKTIVLDNPFFKVVANNRITNSTALLLDSPIEHNWNSNYRNYDSPWRFDIRLKNENGVVVDGPNRGLMPVSREEYQNMDEGRQDKFIPEEKLTDEDIRLPRPTGTRDRLERNEAFWSWVGSQIRERYGEFVKEELQEVQTKEDFIELDDETLNFLRRALGNLGLYTNSLDKFKNDVKSDVGVALSDEAAKILNNLKLKVSQVPQGTDVTRISSSNHHRLSSKKISEILRNAGKEGDVYMAVSLNQTKCNIVWEDNEKNQVVKVKNTAKYSVFNELFGWKKLKSVTKNIEQFNVSKELKNNVGASKSTSNAGKKAPQRTITVHINGTTNENVGSLKSQFLQAEADENETEPFEQLVLFPSNSEKNLTDYKWLSDHRFGVANCTVGVWEYLKECESVTRIESYTSRHKNIEFETSHGVLTAAEAINRGTLVFHILDEETKQLFLRDDVVSFMQNYVSESFAKASNNSEDVIYTPVMESELNKLRVWLRDSDEYLLLSGDYSYKIHGVSSVSIGRESSLYARSQLPDWEGAPELEVFKERSNRLKNGGKELADTLAKVHDSGGEPVSARESEKSEDPLDISVWSSEGRITARDAIGMGTPVFHVLSDELVERFARSTEFMERMREFVIENAHKRFNGDEGITDYLEENEIIYVPIGQLKYSEIYSHLETGYYIRGSGRQDGEEFRIGRTHFAYAHARLPEWVGSAVFEKLESRMDGSIAYNLIDTLGELHDQGIPPAGVSEEELET